MVTEDIVTRLRNWDDQQPPFLIVREAANEIERLRAQIERLSSPLYPAGMNAIDKVEFLHEQIVKIVKGYND